MSVRSNRMLIGIIIIAVALRVGAVFYLGDEVVTLPGTDDQRSYHALAQRVLGGHGFSFGTDWWPVTQAGEPTAHWSYLYTLYLTLVYAVFGPHPIVARLIQAVVVGILHPYLAYQIGRRVFSKKVGLIAAGFTSIYVYFVYYAGTLMTEAFYITAILASLCLILRLVEAQQPELQRKALLLGAVVGVTVLLRQLFLLVIPVLLVWLAWTRYQRDKRLPVKPLE